MSNEITQNLKINKKTLEYNVELLEINVVVRYGCVQNFLKMKNNF